MRKITLLFVMQVLMLSWVFAQTQTVTGKVTDENGAAIAGASVLEKGTKNGTSTAADGTFTLRVKHGAVLTVQGVGLETRTIRASDGMVVRMASSTSNLDEVVVTTALGVRRNINTLPYAAQQVNGDEVSKTNNLNPVSSLSGKVAGLQITQANTMGGSTNVILRGIKSLTQSNQALFVVDGVPYDNANQSMSSFDLGNAAADLNGDDIASVTVLKGAAASALYGSRGSNGVIMITTKRAKSNRISASVSFGATVGFVDNSTLPTYQTQYGQGYGSSTPNSNNSFFYYEPMFNSNGASVPVVQTNNDAATGPAFDPSLQVYTWNSFMPGDPLYGKSSPWVAVKDYKPQDYFVTPVTTSTNVSVYGAGDNGDFKMVYRRDDNKDFMPNSHLTKNNLTLGGTRNVVKNISVGGDFTYQNNAATNRYLYPYTGTTSPMADFRQWWAPNISLGQLKNDYFNAVPGTHANATWNWQKSAFMNNSNIANLSNSAAKPAYHDNPYWFAYTNFENDSRDRFFGNAHIDYKLNTLLHVMARVSKDYYQEMVQTRRDIGSQGTPGYFRFNGSHDEMNYDLQINLNTNLTKDLNLTALLGGNIRQDVDQSLSNATNGGLVVPGVFSISNSTNTPLAPVASGSYINGTTPSEFYGKRQMYSAFGQATLNYKDIVVLDGSLRRDKSSTLPSNNSVYWYPSVSLNFQFSKLLSQWQWLSHGKVWGNYAQVSADAPIYSLYNTYSFLSQFQGQSVATLPSTNNNQFLVPETQKSWETGVEASFLKERLGFSVTYYSAKQFNQIMPASVSTATGFSSFYVNGGTIQNSGFEVQLNLTPVKTRKFQWDMVVNWSNNKQKVISLYNNQPSYAVASYQNSLRLVAVPGQSYQLQGTDYKYSKDGQRLIDNNGYYVINDSSNYLNLGTPFPTWRGGINNSFRYKNFTLSFLVDMSHGGVVYSLDMDYGSGSGLYPRTAGLNDLGKPVRAPLSQGGGIVLKGVHADGTPNTTRIDESDINAGAFSFSSAYGEADREFVYDASYIKLRELNFTYSIPASVFKNVRYIKGVDLSLIGRNLWIIHKNEPYADPEQGQASGNASMGFQSGAYPIYKNIGLNVKINF